MELLAKVDSLSEYPEPVPTSYLRDLGKKPPKGGYLNPAPGMALPMIKGEGDRDFLCPGCQGVLIQGLGPGNSIRGMIIRCPACGTFNGVDV